MAKKKVAKKKKPLGFEQSLEKLEEIVAGLEGGQLSLAESLDRYEEGVGHLRACYTALEEAERRIELVGGVDEEGRPQTQPFEDGGESPVEEKARSRAARRSSPKNNGPGGSGLF